MVDPKKDFSWVQLHQNRRGILTDDVHRNDRIEPNSSPESDSEAVKKLKGEYVLKIIKHHKMEQVSLKIKILLISRVLPSRIKYIRILYFKIFKF